MRRQPRQAGFSLAETLVAITIFVIVVVPFAWTFINSLRTSGQSQHMTVAYGAAQRQIQILRSMAYTNLDNSPPNTYNGGTDFFATATGPSGSIVYRTVIPTAMLPDRRTELPEASGLITLRPNTLTNGNGRAIPWCVATVTITWSEPGHGPMSVTLRTVLSEGGINDV
jgi:prepilin-type N-terminal cleavage/methylation domain-containing protein